MTRSQLNELIEQHLQDYEKKQEENQEREILSRQINAATLQGQINPHFLYNVLEHQGTGPDVPGAGDCGYYGSIV